MEAQKRLDGEHKAYRAEREAALLYQALAEIEKDELWRAAWASLANEEARHAAYWSEQLRAGGRDVYEPELSVRSRLLVRLARRFGTRSLAPVLAAQESQEAARYEAAHLHPEIRLEERRHAQVLRALGRGEPNPLATEPWSDGEGFNLRAAIFGVNDGLVSNLSLTAGLAGAQVEPRMVILGGVAGLLAGALSMAGGEYLSVRSQVELASRQMRLRRLEVEAAPEHAARLLTSSFKARGFESDEARQVAAAMMLSRVSGAEGRLPGLGSPPFAAISSFLAFAVGAALPLAPYMLLPQLGLLLSVAASGVALAGIGGLLGVMSDRGLAWSAVRMLGVGGMAAALTYAAGRVFDLAT